MSNYHQLDELRAIAKWQCLIISRVRTSNFIQQAPPDLRGKEAIEFADHENFLQKLIEQCIDKANEKTIISAIKNSHVNSWMSAHFFKCEKVHGSHFELP
jgi:hypothetical protein